MTNKAVALFLGIVMAMSRASAAPLMTVLSVAGLDCSSWPLKITPAVMAQGGASKVKIDVDRRQLRVDFDDATVRPADFVRILKGLGFAATVVRIDRSTDIRRGLRVCHQRVIFAQQLQTNVNHRTWRCCRSVIG